MNLLFSARIRLTSIIDQYRGCVLGVKRAICCQKSLGILALRTSRCIHSIEFIYDRKHERGGISANKIGRRTAMMATPDRLFWLDGADGEIIGSIEVGIGEDEHFQVDGFLQKGGRLLAIKVSLILFEIVS